MLRILKKFGELLNKQQKSRIVILVILMVIGALLETVGVSLIVPLMTTILNDDFYRTNKYAVLFCKIFDLHAAQSFMIAILLGVALIFALKDLFLLFEYYVQARFVYNNRLYTQQNVMKALLDRPYNYFIHASSGEMIRRITDDVYGSYTLLSTLLSFFTEMIVSIAVIAAIVVIDPVMAVLIMVVLLLELIVIYKLIKPVLRKAGLSRQKNAVLVNKWILQATSGVKEVKVARKERYFIDQFYHYANKCVSADKKKAVLDNVPRLMIEAVTVDTMLVFMAVLLYRGANVASLLPQLAAFAVAAVRLLPSANRISTALNAIAYGEPALDNLLESMQDIKENSNYNEQKISASETITLRNSLALKKICYAYPEADKNVLDEADMVIPVGKSVGIVGASGAGKTTAVDIILGLLQQQSGEVLTDGKDIRSNYDQWLSMIGYIPQMIYMLDDTIRSNVAFGIPVKEVSDEKVWKALEEAQLREFVKSLPEGLDTTIGEQGVRLSGGQRQRIGIARALYTDPSLLILDEATSALDNETEAAIMDSINALHGKKTLIIIAHRLSTIEECDMVYRVENGKIVRER